MIENIADRKAKIIDTKTHRDRQTERKREKERGRVEKQLFHVSARLT